MKLKSLRTNLFLTFIFLDLKLCDKIFFRHKFFGLKIFFLPKIFSTQNFLGPKIFLDTIFLDPNFVICVFFSPDPTPFPGFQEINCLCVFYCQNPNTTSTQSKLTLPKLGFTRKWVCTYKLWIFTI